MKREWGKILKQYKTETCEATVTKKSFPSLLNKLWDQSLYPEHIVSGFRATGIHPLSSKAVYYEKLKPSLPYSDPSSSHDVPAPQTATLITTKVTSIFKEQFQPKMFKQTSKSDRLRPNYYGSEEAVERLQQREEEKEKKKKVKLGEKYLIQGQRQRQGR